MSPPKSPAAPFVSVVICTYNRGPLLVESVESVFKQTYTDFELLIVDDGSTDNTRELLEQWRDRLRYIHQDNGGEAVARNHGVEAARGEWIAFLDSDDLWEPNYLETAVGFIAKNRSIGFVSVATRIMTQDGHLTPRVGRKMTPGDFYTTDSLLAGDVGTIITPLIRRQVYLAAGGFDPTHRTACDCDAWIRVSFHTQMARIHEPLLLYRLHPDNISKNQLANAEHWLMILDKLERLHPDYAAAHPDLFRKNRAKQWLRVGREQLAKADDGASQRAAARKSLLQVVRLTPGRLKAWAYLALATFPGAGALFSRWRRWELATRERFLALPAVTQIHRRRWLKVKEKHS